MAEDAKRKWTPGPWTFFNGGLDGFGIQDNTRKGPRLAHVFYSKMQNGQCEGYELAKANARLIAKAPEMFDLLHAIVDSATDGRDIPEWLAERLIPVTRLLAEIEAQHGA